MIIIVYFQGLKECDHGTLALRVAQYCFSAAARRVTQGAAVPSASRLRVVFGFNLDKSINNLNDLVDQKQRDD